MPQQSKTTAERGHAQSNRGDQGREAAQDDDTRVTALKLKPAELSQDMAALFKLSEEKLGFVPNVLQAFAFDMTKLEAFVAYRNDFDAR